MAILGTIGVICAVYLYFVIAIDCNREREANKIK